jgi:hypothetical protein
MPVVFGEQVSSVQDSVDAFRRHGDRIRGTYRAHYRFDSRSEHPYVAPRLERPESLRESPTDVTFPWEQVFLAAAACAGSDYPMFAAHLGISLESIDLVVEGVFDPRGEFDGISGFRAPADARHCYLSLHLRAKLVSSAARADLEALHDRAMSYNMVLGALRGIPQTNELVIQSPVRAGAATSR